MRFLNSLSVLGFVAASFSLSKAAPVRKIVPHGATNFTSKTQGFTVWMPYKILGSERVSPMKDGGTFSLFYFSSSTEPFLYTILVITPPNVNKSKLGDRLDALQNKWFGSNTKLRRREEVQLGNFIGRDLEFSSKSRKGTIRTRIYLTPEKSYQIIAPNWNAPMQAHTAQIQRVFDSFRILPQ